MGELKNVNMDEGSVVLLADGSYTVVIPVDFTEGTKKYVMNINMATQQIQAEFTDMSAGVVEDTSMGALLKTATVYTIIGIGTVFLVLIFISILTHASNTSMHGKKARRKQQHLLLHQRQQHLLLSQ